MTRNFNPNEPPEARTRRFKKEIAYFMRRLYRRGLTTTSGGNISVRLDDGTMLITPSGSDKGRMRKSEIGRMDLDGNVVEKKFEPSIESWMHARIYAVRLDAVAVVHAHAPMACALAASDVVVNTRYLSETYAILGTVAHADYFTMGTRDLAESVAKAVESADCVIMRNHGALAVGSSLLQAFDRLEVLENAAKTTIVNEFVMKGRSRGIGEEELRAVDALMGRR